MISIPDSTQRRNFLFATISNFFFFCNFSSFFLLPLFIKELGGTEATIGYVMGTFGVTSFGAIPVVAFLIDRYGRRPFMMLGATLMWIASILFLLVHNIGMEIFLLRLLQGAGFATFFTSVSTFIADTLPKEIRSQGLGIFSAFTIASYAVGPSVGEFVVEKVGFDYFFVYASCFSLMAFVLLAFTSKTPYIVSTDKFGVGFFRLVLSKRYRTILFVNLIIAGGLGVMLNFFADYLVMKGYRAAYFFLTYTLTVVFVRLIGGRLPDVYGRKKVALPSLLILGVSLIMIPYISSPQMAVISSLLFSVGYGMLYPAMSSLVVDRAGEDERGKAMGAFNATFSMGINFLAFPFGYIAGLYGYEVMYLTSGFMVLASFVLFAYRERSDSIIS